MHPLLLLLVWLAMGSAGRAQGPPGPGRGVQVGAGLGPGLGGTAAFVDPFLGTFTREGAVYADYQPRVLRGDGRLLTAVGAGGSVRVLRALQTVRGGAPPAFDVDLGVRVGPAFYYAFFEQTAESKSRAFRVMFDPFVRGTLTLAGWPVYVELGSQAPGLRAGLVLGR